MDIGKKIKKLRTEKLMTQSELTGGEITRNMLSRIENGAALPSLGTVVYLAGKLGVPAGYLLSEGEEEFIYHKTAVMKNIRRAYTDRRYELCLDICLSEFDEFDDELELILTDCCLGVAEEAMREGRLRRSCAYLDEAIRHSRRTMFDTTTQLNGAFVMFALLKELSPALDSDETDTGAIVDIYNPSLYGNVFCRYITVILDVEKYDFFMERLKTSGRQLTEFEKLFVLHLKARRQMRDMDFVGAIATLREVTDSETVPERLLLYLCCEDMEICCREVGDYKGAYESSQNKLEILEHMLAEV